MTINQEKPEGRSDKIKENNQLENKKINDC